VLLLGLQRLGELPAPTIVSRSGCNDKCVLHRHRTALCQLQERRAPTAVTKITLLAQRSSSGTKKQVPAACTLLPPRSTP
jgi:hypothetical protein